MLAAGSRQTPARRRARPVVEQDQKGPRAGRARQRDDLDADLAPIVQPHVAAGRHAGLAGLLDRGKDLDQQLRTKDAAQVEAWRAAGGLEIGAGVAAKLQDGEGLVDDEARRRKARQQQPVRFTRQRVRST